MKPTDSYRQAPVPTNMWFQDDTVPSNNITPVEITRAVTDLVPTSGEYFKVNPNFDDGSENYTPKVGGIVKLDKRNPIWQYSDEQIKLGFVEKLKEQYTFVTSQNMEFVINRADGTIQYKYRKDLAVASTKVKAEKIKVSFNDLGVGEPFYIQPEVVDALAPGIIKNWEKKLGMPVTADQQMIKRVNGFCPYLGQGKVGTDIDASFPFSILAIGSEFNINVNSLQANNPEQLDKIRQIIPKLEATTTLIKKSKTEFQSKNNPNQVVQITSKDPNALPIIFHVWVVVVDRSAEPPGGLRLGGKGSINVNDIFVFPDSAIPEAYRQTYKPFNTQFVKVSPDYFMLWKGGKTVVPSIRPDGGDMDFYKFVMLEDKEKDKLKEAYNKMKTGNPMFMIDHSGDLSYTDWNARRVNEQTTVYIKETLQPKKRNTLDIVLEGMFKKFETKKDDLGEYIQVTVQDIAEALGAVGLNYQEFDDKTSPNFEEIKLPKPSDKPKEPTKTDQQAELDIMKVKKNDKGELQPPEFQTAEREEYLGKKVRVGATDKFSWTIGEDNKVIINKVK